MTTHTTQYKLTDSERQKRMNEFAATDEPTALAAELAAARLMAEEAMNAGHHNLAASLFGTIAKLGSAHVASQLRIGELLEKTIVLKLASQLVNLVTEAVRDRFPGWEDVMEELADKVVNIVIETDNDDEPKLLEAPK
jgi:hypothetical protein